MNIGIPKETKSRELRVALSPEVVKSLTAAGFKIVVEKDAGAGSNFSDELYQTAGATIESDVKNIYANSDTILRVNAPVPAEISMMKKGAVLISFMWASTHPELVAPLRPWLAPG